MSFPRYPKYKPSGVEWLGEVPEHWAVSRLGFECDTLVPMRDKPEHLSGDIPWIRIEDFSGKFISDSKSGQGVSPETVRMMNLKILPVGTVLCSCSCIMGATAIVAKPLVTNQTFIGVVPKQSFLSDYLYFLFHTAAEHLNSIGTGAIQAYLSRDDFRRLRVPCPSRNDQTQITAFLDRETSKIDELVAEQRRLMELLKEKRQAVISHAVTKGLNPHAAMKPSGIEWFGNVPQVWTVTKFGRVVFMQEGPGLRTWQFADAGTRVICVTNITEGGIDFSRFEKFISTEEYNISYRHFTVRRGDVLLSSSGNSWGKVAIYEGEDEVILNTSTIRLNESEGSPLSRDYIAMLLQSDTVREQLGLAMTGSCQPNFGPTHLNCVMVAIPSRAEQAAIIEYLNTEILKLDILTAEAQRAIELLQERRTALISAAVTGQIDVRSLNGKQSA